MLMKYAKLSVSSKTEICTNENCFKRIVNGFDNTVTPCTLCRQIVPVKSIEVKRYYSLVDS
jgi:hypothetical protein